jgi:hypothetical protein
MSVRFKESNKNDNINFFQTPFGFTPNKKNNKKNSIYSNFKQESSLTKNQSKPIIIDSNNISSSIKKTFTFNENSSKINSKKIRKEIKVK